ncbi:hypothetical protein G6N74_05700 [Mesorhizobium sp. CGMCC 1.15528]|uniref:Uncharacterized protein n=1 Tax=Mesorhizobium zhangyense TaxID=1776730 RepID=A0A7C9VAP0_9HYPH|nr:hypothetical protein [Mesorhizobium zhangyense]NGN40552.1 hypothetical protein [Mesorhizobium zhangyense]
MITNAHQCRAILIAVFAAMPFAAAAEDAHPLPGVTQPEPIVQDLKPEPSSDPATPGTFKVGNFDVKISGSVIVDVGVNVRKPPR